jgi:cell division transport system permease protein
MMAHVLRRALRSLWENLSLNLVATGVIAAATLLAGVYLAVMINLTSVVDSWDRDVHISAYFFDDVPVDRRFEVKDELGARPEVEDVHYISEAEAAAWLIEKVEDVEPVLSELGPEVLPSSLEITLTDEATGPGQITTFIESIDYAEFEVIDYGQEWVQRFNTFLALLQVMGVVLGSLIFTAAVFLVGNTMHLVVYARKQELETMKLVGATWTFISLPFLLEGAIQGLLGSLVALLGVYGLHRVLLVQLQQALQLAIGDEPLSFLGWQACTGLLLAGVALGVVGCMVSVHRFWRAAP